MKKDFSTNLKIGVLGGGQLGRMLIQEAIDIGIELSVMDKADAPCHKYAANFRIGDITNKSDVLAFGKDLDILTIEIENVNVEALFELEAKGVNVYPQPSVIQLIQDKGLQKKFYTENNLPTAEFQFVENKQELQEKMNFLPYMQKLRKGGYDGKGVQPITSKQEIQHAFDAPSVLEKMVDLKKELSVIVARNSEGEIKTFPLVEQQFNQEANLVEFLFSPANVDDEIAHQADKYARNIIEGLEMVGLLAVEFFLDQEDHLLVNEIAPRPHNSGHQTIEGNYTSQFEQHLRAICGLPLGATEIIQPSVMVNLLGEKGSEGAAIYHGLKDILAIKGVYPHIYGKHISKPFRKMGHITIINPELREAIKIAQNVKNKLKVSGKS